jgi:SAM-dependent methyltransferase
LKEHRPYRGIVDHYERCLERHGDTHLGVDWPNESEALKRYEIMLDVIRPAFSARQTSVLDFGCGASHLYDFILSRGIDTIDYSGLDISPKFIELSKRKFPQNKYYCVDVLEPGSTIPEFDYITMNGVFTEKRELSFDEMMAYFQELVRSVFEAARIGIAFNVMSKHVDWERDDLFHVPFDSMAAFLKQSLSRNYVFRADYGLFEYTTYVYKS